MADLWKTADLGPATPLPTPGALLDSFPPLLAENRAPAAPPASVPTDDFDLLSDDDVPFIEVGGPKPLMRHLDPVASPERGIRNPEFTKPIPAAAISPPSPARNSALHTPHAALDSVMTVRFGAVKAGQRSADSFGPEIVAFHQPDHAVSIQYRSLSAEIAAQLPGSKPRAILLTATRDAVGASTVILNLGVTLAQHNEQRVTLLDANAERPELAAKLGLAASPGLGDVIARHNPPAWSVRETIQPRLFALTAERCDAAAIPALASVIEQLRSRNDWVIVDAGCWAPRLGPLGEACDAIYLVHGDSDASAQEMIAAILKATGRLRGCIITRK